MLGKEIEVSLKGDVAQKTHTTVLERNVNGRTIYAALFLALPEGDNITLSTPSSEVTIFGGQVAELDWREANVIIHPKTPYGSHLHRHEYASSQRIPEAPATGSRDQARQGDREGRPGLPSRYRNGKVVSAAPMGTAAMRYNANGQVAWDEMWTDFCDLAMAGGPPHRDTLLEPVPPDEVKADL